MVNRVAGRQDECRSGVFAPRLLERSGFEVGAQPANMDGRPGCEASAGSHEVAAVRRVVAHARAPRAVRGAGNGLTDSRRVVVVSHATTDTTAVSSIRLVQPR